MENIITKEKLEKYFKITTKALKEAKKKISKEREKEAEEIVNMASNYILDAKHFQEKKEFVNAFAALNYAHGWIDSGARLGIFEVTDDKLFTIK